jgi:hypothetical protein
MSATALSARPLLPQAVRWDEVEPGFRVATRDGECLGFIESTAHGTFVAVDRYSTPVGRYYSLREAKRALRDVERMRKRGPRPSTGGISRWLATASGLTAASLMLTAGALFLPA